MNLADIRKTIHRKFEDRSGITLIDLVASLPLVTLVIIILTLAMLNFVNAYEETKLFTQLQDELFYVIESMRQGYLKQGVTDEGLIGLLTADNVERLSGSSVMIKPVIIEQGTNYYARYFLSDTGQMMLTLQYKYKLYQNERIFPTGTSKIGNIPQFRITNQDIFSVEKGTIEDIAVLGIKLVAQVRFRKRSPRQSSEDDILQNTRTITYRTSVFVGGSK